MNRQDLIQENSDVENIIQKVSIHIVSSTHEPVPDAQHTRSQLLKYWKCASIPRPVRHSPRKSMRVV